LEQMTIVRPFRRITRHRSHIGLTDARTFTNHLVRTAPRQRGCQDTKRRAAGLHAAGFMVAKRFPLDLA
jgi:hypothetical protein